MFTSIRKYQVRRGSAEELARRVLDGFVPLLRQMRGFRGYYLLDGGPDVLITISMFDNADEAFASNVSAADWVRNNVLDFTRGLPEVMVGDVLIAEVKPESLSADPALDDLNADPPGRRVPPSE
jgi:Antibiotic biosynthesis monooxygenase